MEIVPDIQSKRVSLVVAPARKANDIIVDLTTRLVLFGAVEVIDGGNRFDAYRIARAVRRQTIDLTSTLKRIRLARAFTCYQVLSLLVQSPANPSPKIVLDLLATFYDENVAVPEAYRLLKESIKHLQRLSRAAPVVIFAQPPPFGLPERTSFLRCLQEIAGDVFVYEPQVALPPKRLL